MTEDANWTAGKGLTEWAMRSGDELVETAAFMGYRTGPGGIAQPAPEGFQAQAELIRRLIVATCDISDSRPARRIGEAHGGEHTTIVGIRSRWCHRLSRPTRSGQVGCTTSRRAEC